MRKEFFILPHGYVDATGTVHRDGVIREATAADESAARTETRASGGSTHELITLLARVIVRLGKLETINRAVIENLVAVDFVYLQDLYLGVSGKAGPRSQPLRTCPHCGKPLKQESA